MFIFSVFQAQRLFLKIESNTPLATTKGASLEINKKINKKFILCQYPLVI